LPRDGRFFSAIWQDNVRAMRLNWRNFRKAGRFLPGPAKSLPGKNAKQNMIPESRSAATLLQ